MKWLGGLEGFVVGKEKKELNLLGSSGDGGLEITDIYIRLDESFPRNLCFKF